ncbi:MAG: HPr family phosphocarrier protein [Clostridia bacterium]|nr:HPr family phosphocarrier protein [Clostridia bacterium]
MQIFEYTVTADEGLKAYDASRLIQLAVESGCTVTLEKNGKTVNAKKLFAVMGLGIKSPDILKFTVSGANEIKTAENIKALLLEMI